MQDQPTGTCDVASPNHAQDLRDQRVVLTLVLALHPIQLTVPHLVCEVAAGAEDFAESDRIERAVRDLTGIGLLSCPGGLVVPSHAAIRFNELLGS